MGASLKCATKNQEFSTPRGKNYATITEKQQQQWRIFCCHQRKYPTQWVREIVANRGHLSLFQDPWTCLLHLIMWEEFAGVWGGQCITTPKINDFISSSSCQPYLAAPSHQWEQWWALPMFVNVVVGASLLCWRPTLCSSAVWGICFRLQTTIFADTQNYMD